MVVVAVRRLGDHDLALARQHPVGVVHAVDLLDATDHRIEVRRVAELEVEAHLGDAVGAGHRVAAHDVDVVVGEHARDVAQQAGPVEALDLDGGHEHRGDVGVPLDVDEAVGLPDGERLGVGAVGPVHRDAAAPGDEAHDLVAGHRGAAARETHHDVVEALDVHPGLGVARPGRPARRPHRGGELLLTGGVDVLEVAAQALGDRPCPTRGARRWRRTGRRGRRT